MIDMETASNTDNKRMSLQFEYKNAKQNGVESAEVIDNLCYYIHTWKTVRLSGMFCFRDSASTDISQRSKVYEPVGKRIYLRLT